MKRLKKTTAPDVECGKHSWKHLNPPKAFDSANIQFYSGCSVHTGGTQR